MFDVQRMIRLVCDFTMSKPVSSALVARIPSWTSPRMEAVRRDEARDSISSMRTQMNSLGFSLHMRSMAVKIWMMYLALSLKNLLSSVAALI